MKRKLLCVHTVAAVGCWKVLILSGHLTAKGTEIPLLNHKDVRKDFVAFYSLVVYFLCWWQQQYFTSSTKCRRATTLFAGCVLLSFVYWMRRRFPEPTTSTLAKYLQLYATVQSSIHAVRSTLTLAKYFGELEFNAPFE